MNDLGRYSKDWVLEFTQGEKRFEVVWGGFTDESDSVNHLLLVLIDGEYVLRGSLVNAAKQAAVAFRIAELQSEYPVDPFLALSGEPDGGFDLDDDLFDFEDTDLGGKGVIDNDLLDKEIKKFVLEIAERSFSQEFLGQYENQFLYVQTVAAILQTPEGVIWEVAQELQKEGKLSVVDAVLLPYGKNLDKSLTTDPFNTSNIGW